MINLAFTESSSAPDMPFPECGAMSQGYIGFHIQNAIYNALKEEGLKRNVATVVSQVLVDKDDPLFKSPSKPVGAFYSKEEAEKIKADAINVTKSFFISFFIYIQNNIMLIGILHK